MKLTKGQVHDAVRMIKQIADRPRVIPQIAKFKLAKIHDVLEPRFTEVEMERANLVQTHGSMKYMDAEQTKPLGWGLNEGDASFPQFVKDWNAVRGQDAGEFAITPVTLVMLGNDPKGIEIDEFALLGGLIVDNTHEDAEETRG